MLQPKPHPFGSSLRLYWENKARWSSYRKKKKEKSPHHTFPLVAYEIGMNVNISMPESLLLKLSFQINSKCKRNASTELVCSNLYKTATNSEKEHLIHFQQLFQERISHRKVRHYLSIHWDDTRCYPCRGRSKFSWSQMKKFLQSEVGLGHLQKQAHRAEAISYSSLVPLVWWPSQEEKEKSHWQISPTADRYTNK